MANELVSWRTPEGDGAREGEAQRNEGYAGGAEVAGEEWDLPPTYEGLEERSWPRPIHDHESEFGAQRAERDSRRARLRHDDTFAVLREADARDMRQTRWDWGDFRTWAIIGIMFFGFLLFTLFVYAMPQARHASPPPIRVY